MTTIYRYIQLGVHVRARYDKDNGGFMREVCEVCEFHVTRDNVPESHIIYRKNVDGSEIMNQPSEYLIDYLEAQGVMIKDKNYLEKLSREDSQNNAVLENTSDSLIIENSENETLSLNDVVLDSNNSQSNQENMNSVNGYQNIVDKTPEFNNLNDNSEIDTDLEKTQFFDVFKNNG